MKKIIQKIKEIELLYEKNKNLILTHNKDSLIDLIFLLYKSFEIGEADKKIIKKNIAVLGFSVSKAMKEFRYDALKEFKKSFKSLRLMIFIKKFFKSFVIVVFKLVNLKYVDLKIALIKLMIL